MITGRRCSHTPKIMPKKAWHELGEIGISYRSEDRMENSVHKQAKRVGRILVWKCGAGLAGWAVLYLTSSVGWVLICFVVGWRGLSQEAHLASTIVLSIFLNDGYTP